MAIPPVSLSSFRVKKSNVEGVLYVLNEHSYVMGDYNVRSGRMRWTRVLPQPQKLRVEEWLRVEYSSGSR